MKLYACLSAVLLALSAGAHAESVVVSLPSVQVVAIQSANATPTSFASAQGKLTGFFSQSRNIKAVSPQMSLALHNNDYAAVAVEGTTRSAGDVRVISLPACTFVTRKYVGNYDGIRPAQQELIAEAFQDGYMLDESCGVRVVHRNNRHETAPDKLIHEIYVPVTKKLSS